MEDLFQSQIKESCKLALPNGLKELMADISREVLRAQPKDLCRFITDYLSVLLVTRENLSIASRVCSQICDGCCHRELYDELRNIGLKPDDAETAKSIILKYFHSDQVNEGIILMKLIRNMDLNEELLPAIQEAVRTAFLRHQASHIMDLETLSDIAIDEVSRAAAHTMQLYRNVNTTDQEYCRMADKIQAAYRAHGVRRERCPKEGPVAQQFLGKRDEPTQAKERIHQRKFSLNFIGIGPSTSKIHQVPVFSDECITPWNTHKISISTISSTSLAGSYLKLPKYKPYSAIDGDQLNEMEETSGREHAYIDYTAVKGKKEKVKIVTNGEEKRISFGDPRNRDTDVDSEGSIEELIDDYTHTEETCDEETDNVEEIDKIEAIDNMHDETYSITSIETI